MTAMDRRGFLQRAMLAAAALAVDPELLLWKPQAKTIFIPAVIVPEEQMMAEFMEFLRPAQIMGSMKNLKRLNSHWSAENWKPLSSWNAP